MNKSDKRKKSDTEKLNHIAGITEDAGGVDPEIDKTLMRLSTGP